jgi:hypothetical protein
MAKTITEKDEYKYIANLIGASLVDMSRDLSTTDNAVSFRFTETYDREGQLLSITLYSKRPGYTEIAVQEMRYRVTKEGSKYTQFVTAYKNFLNYFLTTACIVLNQVSIEMNADEELQTKSKLIME